MSEIDEPKSTLPARLAAFARQHGGVCYWCEAPVLFDVPTNHGLAPSREHLKPVSKGGRSDPDNLVLAHRACNTRRGTLSPETFRLLIRGVAEQEDAAGLNPVCPSGRAGSTPATPTKKQWISMRNFWPAQSPPASLLGPEVDAKMRQRQQAILSYRVAIREVEAERAKRT